MKTMIGQVLVNNRLEELDMLFIFKNIYVNI